MPISQVEKIALRNEFNRKVNQFLAQFAYGADKVNELYHLVKKVEKGEEDVEVLRAIVTRGNMMLELKAVQEKIETERAYRRLFGKERKH